MGPFWEGFHFINSGAIVFHIYFYDDGLMGKNCLLYTSDAADDLLCVDLGGRRIIKKKKNKKHK